jgi:hypothetical protein
VISVDNSPVVNEKHRHSLAWIIFWLTLISYAYFFQSGQHNENTRFDLMRSLVEDGSFIITRFSHNSADIIPFNNEIYSGKAPGISFLGIPFWALWSKVVPYFVSDAEIASHFMCYLTIVSVVGLPSAMLATALFLVLSLMGKLRDAFFLTLIFAFGTIAFPFSTLLFSHQLCSALVFIGFAIVYLYSHTLLIFLAGILMGFSVVVEYPGAIGAGLIGLYVLYKRGLLNGAIPLALGGLLGVSPLIYYNLSVFGKLMYTPYSVYAEKASNDFPVHKEGLLGISVPYYENFELVFTSLHRGLFVLNPITILLLAAIPLAFYIKRNRSEKFLAISLIIGYLYLNLSFGTGLIYAGGGCSVGPRHVIPMLPFMFFIFIDLMNWRAFKIPSFLLGLISSGIMLMATATEPRVPYEYENPIKDLFWKGFLVGQMAIETDGVFSSKLITEDTIAFNLGKLFNIHSSIQLLPLLVIWAVFYLLSRKFLKEGENRGIVFYDLSIFVFLSFLAISPVVYYYLNKPEDVNSGFAARYFEGKAWETCQSDLTAGTDLGKAPILKTTDYKLDFEWHSRDFIKFIIDFSADWSGDFQVEETGLYRFKTESDDGSCIYIDGRLLVDNWGEHMLESRESSIVLLAGSHNLYVRYMSFADNAKLNVTWGRKDKPFIPISVKNFTPKVLEFPVEKKDK